MKCRVATAALVGALSAYAFACGNGGSRSPDGGSTSASFWSVGIRESGGVVLRSQDAGASWHIVETTPRGLGGVAFVGPERGWVVGNGLILHTSDGGDSWMTQVDSFDALFAVAFTSPVRGVAVGRALPVSGTFGDSLILMTDDGGSQWRPATIVPRIGNFGQRALLSTVCFTASGTAGLVVGNGPSGSVVLLSRNEGEQWQDITDRVGEGGFSGAGCGRSDLWVAELDGDLYRSRDDGVTWTNVRTALPGSFAGGLGEFVFVDESRGWVVGTDENDRPIVLHTINGGDSWVVQPLPTSDLGVLHGVAFMPDGIGVAVGAITEASAAMSRPLAFTSRNNGNDWGAGAFEFNEGAITDVSIASE